MRAKPDLDDDDVIAFLTGQYGLRVRDLAFMPVGNDAGAGVYSVVAEDGSRFLLKVRSNGFEEATVAVPGYLRAQGIGEVVAPVATSSGSMTVELHGHGFALYPYVDGQMGWGVSLSGPQWARLGAAIRRMHDAPVPAEIERLLPAEAYSGIWRAAVLELDAEVAGGWDDDSLARDLGAFWTARGPAIDEIADRAGRLAGLLREQDLPRVICHADLHAGNILVSPEGDVHLVDWDDVRLAPPERDLMFIGGGVGGVWNTDADEVAFREGYGRESPDPVALAYYRAERIVEDTVVTVRFVLSTANAIADRRKGLRDLANQFERGNVVDRADRAFQLL